MTIEPQTKHFQALSPSMRLTYTLALMVLGLGYLFAIIHVFASHAGRDGDPGLSVTDLIVAYRGSATDTQLEAALKGPMQSMLPDKESNELIAWVRGGADKATFDQNISPIIKTRCVACHDGSNPHVATLLTHEDVAKLAEQDTGMDIFTLVRVSHIHLFGLTFIFFIVSSIFAHAHVRPLWLKYAVIATPFVGVVLDVGSWYLTKMYDNFAYFALGGGALIGASFAFQWFVSIYQMWFYRLPDELRPADGTLPSPGVHDGDERRS